MSTEMQLGFRNIQKEIDLLRHDLKWFKEKIILTIDEINRIKNIINEVIEEYDHG